METALNRVLTVDGDNETEVPARCVPQFDVATDPVDAWRNTLVVLAVNTVDVASAIARGT